MTASPLRPSTATSHALTVAAALGAAREAGLVRLLDDGPIGIDALAGRTESHPRGVRLVMDGLVAAGIVDSSGQGYRWHPSSAADDLEQLWLGMTHLLSTGSAPISVDEPDVAGRLYPPVVTAIARHAESAAERVSTLVESNARVLDVGSGAAPFGIAAAGAGGVVTLLDLPEVVDVGATRARDLGLAVSTIAGDVFDTLARPSAGFLVRRGGDRWLLSALRRRQG
ncbi:MAG: hypothetical protein R2710_16585 [Acidimicrobiales bacterium]